MKAVFSIFLLLFITSFSLLAQRPTNPSTSDNNNDFVLPGSGQDNATPSQFAPPIDDIVETSIKVERQVLPYEHIRESDVMWKKRIWRVIDVREKINLPFSNPQRPLINIIIEAAEEGKIPLYSTLDDKFTTELTEAELSSIGGGIDTVEVINEETYETTYEEVPRELNPDHIKRYRLKEIWFFDKESSRMNVRILGIAPLIEEYDENGKLITELPMFWVYYPHIRQVLANEEAFVFGNDAGHRSWEDVFELRYFNSYIFKESNVLDRRVEGYVTNGRERLMEAERIKQEILNYEQDLWSY